MPHAKNVTSQKTRAPSSKGSKRSSLVSRNIVVSNRRTSIRLEPDMWDGLRDICRREHSSLHQICTSVAQLKTEETSLTAAIRVFVMLYFRRASTEEGHRRAGHGCHAEPPISSHNVSSYPYAPASALTKTSFT